MTTREHRIGLEEALRLSAVFSAQSTDGEVPESTPIPVPRREYCEFDPRPWGVVSNDEREAFHRFYEHVGGALEDAATSIRSGSDLSQSDWDQIIRDVREAV